MIESLTTQLNTLAPIEIARADEFGNWREGKHYSQISVSEIEKLISTDYNLCFLNGLDPNIQWASNWSYQRASDKGIVAKNIATFDLDFKDCISIGPAFLSLPPEKKIEKAKNVASCLKLTPTPWIVNFTGNGIHLHYRLSRIVQGEELTSWKQHYLRVLSQIESQLPPGLKLDQSCQNIARIFRLPGTLNTKPGTTPIRGQVLSFAETWLEWPVNEKTWGAGEAQIDEFDTLRRDSTITKIGDALTPQAIFNHFGIGIHNEKNDSHGQWWCSSPWRNSEKPIHLSTPSFCYSKSNGWFCHSSGKGGDMYCLIAELAGLDHRNDFLQLVAIGEEITGIYRPRKKTKVTTLSSYKPANNEEISQLLATVPLDIEKIKLASALEPVFAVLARANGTVDEFVLDQIKETWGLTMAQVSSFRARVKVLRQASLESNIISEKKKTEDEEFDPVPYYNLFQQLSIKHDELTGWPVHYSEAVQRISEGGTLRYAITPARIESYRNKRLKEYLEGMALTTPGVDFRHVHRMLTRWIMEEKKPQILIKVVEPENYDNLLDSALGTIIKSFDIDEHKEKDKLDKLFRFTTLEICQIYNYCLALAHLKIKNNTIRPVVPVLVSTRENIGKDIAIGAMILHWHPYVKKISFGKGSQEKEIQRAFSSSLIQHIEEFEKIGEMNPAFIRSLFSGDYSDTTLKGDNDTTRLLYRGIALGSANNTGFLIPGIDNSRFVPIVINSIYKKAYCPCVELSAQVWAQTRVAAENGSYGLSDELWEKIRRVQKFYSTDSEGHSFAEIFTTVLKEVLQSRQGIEIRKRGFITLEEISQIQIFDKIQERKPAYRNYTDHQFRKLLRQGGLYRPNNLFWTGSTAKRGIQLPGELKLDKTFAPITTIEAPGRELFE